MTFTDIIIWVISIPFVIILVGVVVSAIPLLFSKGSEGDEVRSCCLPYLIGTLVLFLLALGIRFFRKDDSKVVKKEKVERLYSPRTSKKSEHHPAVYAPEGFVYICTGGSSRKYHRNENCNGLSNCTGDVELITLEEAEEMGRTECLRCY